VVWLQGAACTGCSVSFLNRISNSAPRTAADVLISTINLTYHPNLMAVAGEAAAQVAETTRRSRNYILCVEGGVPTAFGGAACWAWTAGGRDVTFLEAVRGLAANAKRIISIGTCAAWGGIPAAGPNPTGVQGVSAATGKAAVSIGGCPPHPDWIVWAIASALTNTLGEFDDQGRPKALFSKSVHDQCPRKGTQPARGYDEDNRCLKELGCKGPQTRANCPVHKWNGGQNWCVDANAICVNCTDRRFPFDRLRKEVL
jgi:hydrogenase small subunit